MVFFFFCDLGLTHDDGEDDENIFNVDQVLQPSLIDLIARPHRSLLPSAADSRRFATGRKPHAAARTERTGSTASMRAWHGLAHVMDQ